jgi:hypothetical protein
LLAASLCAVLDGRPKVHCRQWPAVFVAAALMTLRLNGRTAATEGVIGTSPVQQWWLQQDCGAQTWLVLRLTVEAHIQPDQIAAKALLA